MAPLAKCCVLVLQCIYSTCNANELCISSSNVFNFIQMQCVCCSLYNALCPDNLVTFLQFYFALLSLAVLIFVLFCFFFLFFFLLFCFALFFVQCFCSVLLCSVFCFVLFCSVLLCSLLFVLFCFVLFCFVLLSFFVLVLFFVLFCDSTHSVDLCKEQTKMYVVIC